VSNLYAHFKRLLPSDPVQFVTVQIHHADGSSTVETPTGGVLRVRGTDVAVGDRAYIQGGRIIEGAPDLPVFMEEV
jgi:hypothetical protein